MWQNTPHKIRRREREREGGEVPDDEKRAGRISIGMVGFVAGVLTVLLVLFALKGC
jgi:hypothetical protein